MVKGKLKGNFQASGKTGDPEALSDKAKSLCGTAASRCKLLVLLGQILQIEELQELNLEQAEAKYTLAAGADHD